MHSSYLNQIATLPKAQVLGYRDHADAGADDEEEDTLLQFVRP